MLTKILFVLVAVWAMGIIIYAAKFGDETPESFKTDVEHGPDGKPLPKTDERYWLIVFAEGLFSYPAAGLTKGVVALRKALGAPQK